MSINNEEGNNISTLAKIATFIRGVNLMQPFLVCLLGSSFAMERFGYAKEAVSIFVTFCSNAMEIIYTCTILSTTLIIGVVKYSAEAYFRYITSGMSMLSVCFTVVVNSLLLRLYALADDVDNITRYYWMLLVANFAAGIDVTCVSTIAADNMSSFGFGISLAGLVAAVFQLLAINILGHRGMDVHYWLIVYQFVLILSISSIGAVSWIAFLFQDKILGAAGENNNSGDAGSGATVKSSMGYLRTIPMLVASAVALGTLWGIYPYISPFEIIEFQYQYPLQIFCVVFDALVGLVLLLLDNVAKCLQKDWYKFPYAWWHLLWLLVIPYLGIAMVFLRCLHYPHSALGRAVLPKPMVAGFLTVVYYTISRILYGFGHTAIDANALGHGEVISPLSVGIDFLVLNVMKYMSGAYVQQLNLAKEGVEAGKAWPTAGMSDNSAVRYWIRTAARVGYGNFKELASADVKQRLGGVARRVVSYRRAASSLA